MKLVDVVSSIRIDPRKLTNYALNPDSKSGGAPKALLFEKLLGFTKENYSELLRQIEEKALQAEALFQKEDKHGKRYQVDLLIEGLVGKCIVRTGWIVSPNADYAKLTTIYIKKR